MGEIAPVGDARALADAVTRVVEGRASYVRPRKAVAALFDLERTLSAYEALFEEAGRTVRLGRVGDAGVS
jgi:hypothetical protein